MKQKSEISLSKHVPHMWCRMIVGIGLVQFRNCKHCGLDHEYYCHAQNIINEKFMLGKISIEKQKQDLAELEKCLTEEELIVKDVLQ